MATKVKICGITNLKDALMAIKYGADAIGFVLAPSPRRISLSRAKKIVKNLPPFITTVAVVVNKKRSDLNRIIKTGIFNALQLHGEEKPEYCHYLKDKIKVIKAFRIKDKKSFKNIYSYQVDAILLDTFTNQTYGGTGKSFYWNLLREIKNKKLPIILSGGLNSNNVSSAIKKARPYAVDISSGVEEYPGKKNQNLVKKFISNVRKTDDLFCN